MSDSAIPKPLPATRDWGRNNNGADSAFSGLGRGKRGGSSGRGISRGGRGAGRGGAGFRGRGRGRGSGGNGATMMTMDALPTTTAVTKVVENASKSSLTMSKGPSKPSETATTPKNPSGKSGARRRPITKTIPQIIVPPPSMTSTTITDEINALVEHVRAGALTPNGAITPFTPSHIDWAGDDEDDGSLPDLNDWGVSTSSGEALNNAELAGTAEAFISSTMKSDAISPILVEGLKSLPEPKVPEHPETEAEVKVAFPVPSPEPLPPKQASTTNPTSTSSSLHPSLQPKPTLGSTSTKNSPDITGTTRGGSISHPPRNSRSDRSVLTASQPGPEPSHQAAKNFSKPVSGRVPLSTSLPSSNQGATSLTPPESSKKGLTDSIYAPKPELEPASAEVIQPKAKIPAPLNSNGGSMSKIGSYVPPYTRSTRSTFVPTPAPPPNTNGGLAAEFTFPSLSPSPISGHYPSGSRGPGGGPSESGEPDRLQNRPNNRNSHPNGNGAGRNKFNPRSSNPTLRHYQQDQIPSANHLSRDRLVHQPQAQSHLSDPLHRRSNHSHSPHHSPRHTPHHSREHSASRPVITGDAISKLARTIAGSPAKA